jgi:CRISPR-associated protein Cas1
MLGQVLEIETPGRKLSLNRGFLDIHDSERLLGSVPVQDVEALLLSTPAYQISGQALSALLENGTPVVFCGTDFKPSGYILPTQGHHQQGARMQSQANAGKPLKKQLWRQIVIAKILAQADALDQVGGQSAAVRSLAPRVRSGDPDNLEANAAQRYFPLFFGREFRRGESAHGINTFLNYGYTVLRTATVRAIISAGLHPSLSIFHVSDGDALRLADDIMEPFRPVVDLEVRAIVEAGATSMSPELKRRLVAILRQDFNMSDGARPLTQVLNRVAVSLAHTYEGKRKSLELPSPLIPMSNCKTGRDLGGAA